ADLDMWVRLLEHGSALVIPRVTALYHVHAGQVSTDPKQMHAAHKAVLDSHADRPWCTRALQRRHEGVLAWDARRKSSGGALGGATAMRLAWRLASPQRTIGVVQLLTGRFKARRLAARLAPGGVPSVAILPGAPVDPSSVPGAVDLRDRGLAGALLHLLRRPTTRAVVRGRPRALLVRALGVEPVQPTRGRAGAP
ncbi:MAG: hypothetical protein QOK25_2618, partial [Thermoleophilaceae bacterium]|nr:hypothetical protein [Thermoleophilaceae bacterium]